MSKPGLRRALRLFGRNQHGGVSTIMAFSTIPLILLVGASVDYTRAVTRKTSLQQATDATTLAVAHYLTQNLTSTQLATNTKNYFAAAVNSTTASITSGPTVSSDNTTVCLSAQDQVPTAIMQAASGMGFSATSTMPVGATSCAKINNMTFEIAMALDNSGSMNDATSGATKMAALITAANQLVAIMDPAGQTPKTSFSVVPFSSAVKLDPGYQTASFMDTQGKSSIHWQNFQLPTKSSAWHPTSKFDFYAGIGQKWAGCVEERPGAYMTSDAPSLSTAPDSLFVPYLYPDEGSSKVNAYKKYSPANSYLNDSNSNCSDTVYQQADAPGSTTPVANVVANTLMGNTQTEICKYNKQTPSLLGTSLGTSGPNLMCDSTTLMTLTNDTSAVSNKINSMYAKGDTNLISGFMWAWRTISPNGPFGTQAVTSIGNQNPLPYSGTPAANNNQKIIILMTDGFNHWVNNIESYGFNNPNGGGYSSFGYFPNNRLGTGIDGSNYRTVMDNVTLQACANAKAAGVQIFTVGFSVPSNPIDSAGQTLLQQCASKPSMYYAPSDGSTLIADFQDMANQMSGLRLTN